MRCHRFPARLASVLLGLSWVSPQALGAQERPSNGAVGPPALWLEDGSADAGLGGFSNLSGAADKPYVTDSFGAGVALLDYDGDGALDVFLVGGGSADRGGRPIGAKDGLYAGLGDGRFVEVTAEAGIERRGWSYGALAADLDGDGWTDLFVTCRGRNTFWRNQGDGTFADHTLAAGFAHVEWSAGAAVLDYDRDGDLDLWVVGHIDFDPQAIDAAGPGETYLGQPVYSGPRGLPAIADRLYRNEGDGSFADVSEQAGITSQRAPGFQAVVLDFDRDGWPDVYVANDSKPNQLWRNDGEGRFADVALITGCALSLDGGAQASMGVAVGDVQGDGELDLFVTNFSEDSATLYSGQGADGFRDTTLRAGLAGPTRSSLGWAALLLDLDQDGDLDIFSANGHVYPQMEAAREGPGYKQSDQVFENLGAGRFAEPEGGGGPGVCVRASSRGAAAGDLDGDGDLDLVVGRLDGSPAVLFNRGAGVGAVLWVELEGKRPNTAAVGARLVARSGDRRWERTVGSGQGFLSGQAPGLHLGLGEIERLDELHLTWPDGSTTSMEDVPVNRRVRLRQGIGAVDLVKLEDPR